MKQKQTTKKQDAFRRIKGIGPVTEGRLHEAEIQTYAQLTAVSPQALAELLPGITTERIQQEDWQGQAEALLSADSTTNSNGQHYATFTVELLLDKDNTVRRTRVVHVQQEENKKSWSEWQPKEVERFIVLHAQLVKKQTVNAKPKAETPAADVVPPAAPQQPKSAIRSTPTHALREESIDAMTMRFLQPLQSDAQKTAVNSNKLPIRQETVDQPKPMLHPLSVELNTPNILLEHGHAFNVQLYLDLEQLSYDRQTPLNYQAAIYAAQLGSASRQKVGTAHGAINTAAKKVAINVPTQISTPGTYRLEAEMAIAWIPATPDITANSKGGLLHVY